MNVRKFCSACVLHLDKRCVKCLTICMQESGSSVLKIWVLTKNSDSLSTLGCIYLTFIPLAYYLLLQKITDKKVYEEKDGFYSDICFLIVHDSTQRICLLSQFSFFIFPVHVFFFFHHFRVCQYIVFTKLLQLLTHLRSVS
jgi:hypothetical protein